MSKTLEVDGGVKADRNALAIVKRRARGKEADFSAFYSAYFRKVYDSAFAYCGRDDLAYEATQEAFSRALARWRTVSQYAWVDGWTITTAINYLRRRARRWRQETELTQPGPESASHGPPGPAGVDLLTSLRRLPQRQRQAAVLYYVADYPVAEVASLMDLSQGAVKAHLAKARASLRRDLGETYTEDSDA